MFFMYGRNEVGAVVHGYVRLGRNDCLNMFEKGIAILAGNRKDGNSMLNNEPSRGFVLR